MKPPRRRPARGARVCATLAALTAIGAGCGGPPRPPPTLSAAERAAAKADAAFPADVITFEQDLAWSPDGSQLAFSLRQISRPRWDAVHHDALIGTQYDAYLIGVDGHGLRQLTTDPGNDLWLSWFPDGKQVAFAGTRDDETAVYAVKTGVDEPDPGPRRITPPLAQIADTAWSPDGRRVVYSAKVDAHNQLYIATLIGTDVRQLTRDDFDHRGPVWSPDGRMLVFQGNPRGPSREDIFILDVDSGAVTTVTDDDANDFYPGWLPDGRVTFTTVDGDGRKHVVAQGQDRAKREVLVDGAFFGRVSPDGRTLAYITGELPDSAIYVRPIDPTATPLQIVE